jgi:hypothetical protein
MSQDPTPSDDASADVADQPDPTTTELAGTIFEEVGDFSQDNGGAELITNAAIGGGDG